MRQGRIGQPRLLHGLSVDPVWAPILRRCYNAISRCHNPNHKAFKNYGARGIEVIARWRDVETFAREIVLEIGLPKDGASIDRIDNHQGYKPGNIRWANRSQQARNRRNSVTVAGVAAAELAERLGCTREAIYYRLRKGWSLADIAKQPPRVYPR